jgi:hypothetical protein
MSHRIIQFFTFFSIVILVASCGKNDNPSNSTQETPTVENHSHQRHDHSQQNQLTGMELDNGKKWKMDEHTRSIFVKMVASFTTSDHSTVAGLQNSGIQLKGQLNDLIQGCTMVGDAHNQLHVFLTEYIPAVELLASSNDLESGKEQAIKVKGFLDMYGDYFE